jgi:hypothetical protein
VYWSSVLFKDHADVVQSGNEGRSIDLPRTARPVTETNDVRATLPKTCLDGKSLRLIGERDKPRFTVGVVSHQDRQSPTGLKYIRRMSNCECVAAEELFQRCCPRQVARNIRVEFLTPVPRMQPGKFKCLAVGDSLVTVKISGITEVETLVNVT